MEELMKAFFEYAKAKAAFEALVKEKGFSSRKEAQKALADHYWKAREGGTKK